jgi:hypothetical protein
VEVDKPLSLQQLWEQTRPAVRQALVGVDREPLEMRIDPFSSWKVQLDCPHGSTPFFLSSCFA